MKQYNPVNHTFDRPVKVAVISTQWNSHITSKLVDGAVEVLAATPNVTFARFEVPGAVELTYAAQQVVDTEEFDAVIVFGCVIKGDTPHFDYVCQSVTQGITAINVDSSVPVIFGVLTVFDEQQALDRCGGSAGHKGIEAAHTALSMVAFRNEIYEY